MKKTYLFLLFLLSYSLYSQNIKTHEQPILGDSAYITQYNKLKDLYIKMLKSPSNIEAEKLMSLFKDKMNFHGDRIKFAREGVLPWIKENIGTTKFESYDAALQEWDILVKAQQIVIEQNPEYYNCLIESVQKYKGTILLELLREVKDDYSGFR